MYKPNTRYAALLHLICEGYAAKDRDLKLVPEALLHLICEGYAAGSHKNAIC